jgi:HSP20 family molecular chaperone IbpA
MVKMLPMPRMHRDVGPDFFEDVFDDPFFERKDIKLMKTDIKEEDGNVVVEIDLPGYEKEDIKVDLEDGYLTVKAEKNEKKEDDKKGKYIRRERFMGMCSRSYYVGNSVRHEDIKANFKNGILTLTYPKNSESEGKRYIEIGE